ncbi:restriction endonuclease subunit S [Tumebacillus permanentifrigoris]|uniref:Type I restriction enzyme S subunit n=1 Tax=Tumebacillus permanentifrigoris TaxID=378543 RepID=A0A316D3N0_9BACL|nr:restriction endonuclease subunit S [Tumebacillus permanentifrigoris]PWK03961.1 type I restriction enzyme S subunit [Tumebacillus permanentifrigoris]
MRELSRPIDRLEEKVLVPESEQSFKIPDNWIWVRIGTILPPMRTRNPEKLGSNFFTYIDIESINNVNQEVESPKKLPVSEAPSRAQRAVHNGDVIISLVRPYLKNIALIDSEYEHAVASTAFYVCGSSQAYDCRFLYHFLRSDYSTQYLVANTKGDNSPSVRSADFLEMAIPLPPLPEQKRIVDRIESLLGKVNEAKKSIEGTLDFLYQFRQAVLLLASSGQLTAEWRKNHPHLETATDLLKRISERREEVYKQRCQLAKKNGERSPRKPMEYMKVENDEINIPHSWALALPEHICSPDDYAIGIGPFGSNLKVSDYASEGVPLVFVRNIRSGDFAGLDPKYVSHKKAEELLPHMVRSLDLLITKMGEPPGDCEIYPENMHDAVITSDVIKLRIWENDLVTEYFKHCINSSLIKKQLGLITKGVTLQKLSLERFRSIMIPVPPLEEQKEIVRCIKLLLDHADQIEGLYLGTKSRIDTITQSILSKAFRGELGTNDPSEESALELLQQVLAERMDEAPKKKKAANTK